MAYLIILIVIGRKKCSKSGKIVGIYHFARLQEYPDRRLTRLHSLMDPDTTGVRGEKMEARKL